MNLSTIEMTKEEAEAALAEWQNATKSRHEDEDAAIAEGYALLAEGKSLIMLSETIRAGGEDDLYRPRLAVAPVNADVIYLDRRRDGDVRFCVREQSSWWSRDVGSGGVWAHNVLSPIEYEDYRKLMDWRDSCLWKAIVPVVPPRYRTRGWKGAHVLFEAEWMKHTPVAPIDPALIKHVRGDLWVVLGMWDLTPLERAVLVERNLG